MEAYGREQNYKDYCTLEQLFLLDGKKAVMDGTDKFKRQENKENRT